LLSLVEHFFISATVAATYHETRNDFCLIAERTMCGCCVPRQQRNAIKCRIMADISAGEKLKVFISYSRKDSAAFADELLAGLEVAGFAPFLDRRDIAPGEPWEARLGGLITQSDTVVFVVSPEALKSKQCTWEVDRTLEVSKRLLPVIFKSAPDHDIPEKLRRLQFVSFDSGTGFARPLSQLAEALRVDLQRIREHTRLGEIATRWDKRGQSCRNQMILPFFCIPQGRHRNQS
jgi:TIR domain